MQRLCALSIQVLLLLVFVNSVSAEPTDVTFRTYTSESRGNPSVQFPQAQKRNQSGIELKAALARSNEGLRISGGFSRNKNDYSNYSVQSEDGTERFLSNQFSQAEDAGTLTLNYAKGEQTINGSFASSLSQSPFEFKDGGIEYAYQYVPGLAAVYIGFMQSEAKQPLTFYTDLGSAKRVQRPTLLDSQTLYVRTDFIISEYTRGSLQIETNTKTDRPRSTGQTLRLSHALSAANFVHGEITQAQENRQERLRDDRGYYSLEGAKVSYERYISFDWRARASYGLIKEIENNPQNGRVDQLVTDEYQVELEYEGKKVKAFAGVNILNSNQSYSLSQYIGGAQWFF